MLRTRKDVNSGNFSRCKTLGRVWFKARHFHLNLRHRCPCIVFHHKWELYYCFCHNWLLSWTFLWNLSSCCWLPTPPLSKRRSSLRFKMCRVDQTWPILCAFTNSQMSRFGCIQSYRKSHNLGLGCKINSRYRKWAKWLHVIKEVKQSRKLKCAFQILEKLWWLYIVTLRISYYSWAFFVIERECIEFIFCQYHPALWVVISNNSRSGKRMAIHCLELEWIGKYAPLGNLHP